MSPAIVADMVRGEQLSYPYSQMMAGMDSIHGEKLPRPCF